jgi:hypothetical protein
MKAEERKHLKENELAQRLRRYWRSIGSGSTTSTIVFGVILVGLAVAIGWRYFSNSTLRARSAEWTAVEREGSIDDLKAFIKSNPGTVVGRVAKFNLTRRQMEDALVRVGSPTSEVRLAAADELMGIRDRYAELAKEARDEPELVQEALMGVAKAEEVLAAIPKADNPEVPRGSLDAAQTAYEELATRFPDSYLGKQAAKRAQDLREHKIQIRAFYNELMEAHGKPAFNPVLPARPPAPPGPDDPKPVDPKDVPPLPPTPAPTTPPDKAPTPAAPPAGGAPAEPEKEPKPKAP